MPERRRRILFVCTANICRSPTAELIARAEFGEGRFLFRSAGFLASGHSVPTTLAAVLDGRGIDGSQHRSHQLDEATVRAADLLLTMEGRHVQQATAIVPAALAKVVPLRQAHALLESQGTQVPVTQFVARLNEFRQPEEYLGSQWDVDDPFGGNRRAYQRAVQEITDLVTGVLSRLV